MKHNFKWSRHAIHRLAERFGIYGSTERANIVSRATEVDVSDDLTILVDASVGIELRVQRGRILTVINLSGFHTGISFRDWVFNSKYDIKLNELANIQQTRIKSGLDTEVSVGLGHQLNLTDNI